MSQRRVAVVGAGILGVSTAEWLRRDGHDVTLIDRNNPGEPAQTSYGNAGILAASSFIPVPVPGLLSKIPKMLLDPMGPLHLKWSYLPRLVPWLIPFLRRANKKDVENTARALATIVTDTVEQHRALAAGTGAEQYIAPGIYAFLYRSQEACEADETGHALRRSYGTNVEFRDRARLLQDDPALGGRYNYAACHKDHGWITNPAAYVAALFSHFSGQGGSFLQAEADDIEPGLDSATVRAAGTAHNFDQVVLSGGAWSGKLARKLGHNPALETERGYHLLLKNPSHSAPFPYMLTDSKFVATPMESGLRCAGQVEFGGLKAGPSRAPFLLVKTRVSQLYPDLTWDG
ncbi:MAG: FAD-dependent oxidoreductase, partial [Pseudomonadota bacterium]